MEVLKEKKEFDLKAMMTSEFPEVRLEQARPFMELMMQYRCALMEVETKLNVLNAEFTMRNNRNPFESIKSRIKSPVSILEKMHRKGYELSAESIEENLADIAGIRVICSFPDDIYATAKLLTQQDDITVLEVKDYIKHPKENGYRSLHLILEIPIFLSEQKKNMKVEVQFRTIAMDFWASLEHKLKYKKEYGRKEIFRRKYRFAKRAPWCNEGYLWPHGGDRVAVCDPNFVDDFTGGFFQPVYPRDLWWIYGFCIVYCSDYHQQRGKPGKQTDVDHYNDVTAVGRRGFVFVCGNAAGISTAGKAVEQYL